MYKRTKVIFAIEEKISPYSKPKLWVPPGPTLIAKIYMQPTTDFLDGKRTSSQVPLF